MAPAIIHDFLYWQQTCTKDEADAILYVALKNIGVNDFDARAVYKGVRTDAAERAWRDNASARQRGETRFFTAKYARRMLDARLEAGQTLNALQTAAIVHGGVWIPATNDASLVAACKAGMSEYLKLRAV